MKRSDLIFSVIAGLVCSAIIYTCTFGELVTAVVSGVITAILAYAACLIVGE